MGAVDSQMGAENGPSPVPSSGDDGGDDGELPKHPSPTLEDVHNFNQAAKDQEQTAPVRYPSQDPKDLEAARAQRERLIAPIRQRVEEKMKSDPEFCRLMEEKDLYYRGKCKKPNRPNRPNKGDYDGFEGDVVPPHESLRFTYSYIEFLLRRFEDEANIVYSNTSTMYELQTNKL